MGIKFINVHDFNIEIFLCVLNYTDLSQIYVQFPTIIVMSIYLLINNHELMCSKLSSQTDLQEIH